MVHGCVKRQRLAYGLLSQRQALHQHPAPMIRRILLAFRDDGLARRGQNLLTSSDARTWVRSLGYRPNTQVAENNSLGISEAACRTQPRLDGNARSKASTTKGNSGLLPA